MSLMNKRKRRGPRFDPCGFDAKDEFVCLIEINKTDYNQLVDLPLTMK